MITRLTMLVLTTVLTMAHAGTIPYPFSDGFETGSYSPNWSAGTGSFTRSVVTSPVASGSYALRLSGGSSTHRTGVSASFSTPQTPTSATVKIRSSSTSNADGYFVLGPSGSCAVFVYFPGDGYIYVNADKTRRYTANTWYTIHIEFDWDARTITYYVDGLLVKSGVAFTNSVSSISSVYLYNFHSGSVAYWDDISFGTGGAVPGISSGSYPLFADLDDDGDMDLLVGDAAGGTVADTAVTVDGWELKSARYNGLVTPGGLNLYRNAGNDSAAVYRIAGTGLERGNAPAAADMDGDGDPDLLVGSSDGTMSYYRSVSGNSFVLEDTNYAGIKVGADSRPAVADLDGDGDNDLISGAADGKLWFFRNNGTVVSPSFSLVDSQYYNIDAGTHSVPSLVDIDNDGDLDMMVGNGAGVLAYYRNDGSAAAPAFVTVDTAFFTIDAGSNLAPAWADLDNDGDYDLYAGSLGGGIKRYRNTGTASFPYFSNVSSIYDFALSVSGNAAPVLADLDADGDNDLLIGTEYGRLTYYRNEGSAGAPVWSAPDTAYGGITAGTFAVPALADVDADGDLDLFVGKYDGKISFYLNEGTAQAASWSLLDSSYFNIDVSSVSAPALTDIDNDGDYDLFIGNIGGTIYLYENRGSAAGALFSHASSAYQGIDVGTASTPAFADLDKDGLPDLLVGNSTGDVYAYYNGGTADSAQFILVEQNYASMDAGAQGVPALADLDGDGDLDMLLGRDDGYLAWYGNVNAADLIAPVWGQGEAGYLGIDVGSYAVPAWADLDDDGDLDLLVGNSSGRLYFYRNGGTASAPACTLESTYYDSISKGSYAAPALADIDGDGDLDMLLGGYDGTVSLYTNTGTASVPEWTLFDAMYFSIDVGSYATPEFCDIDADGDVDLFIGNSAGTVHFYRNQGTAQGPYWRQESTQYSGIDVGSNSVPAFTDADGDGDLDLFIGNSAGVIYAYVNDSTAQNAHYVLDDMMFNDIDVGSYAAPAFADVDGDNRIGLFVGEYYGTISYWEMVRPVSSIRRITERTGLVPAGMPAGLYDLRGRRVREDRVQPGMYLLVPGDGSGIIKKVLYH